MKVSELITLLEAMPKDAIVGVNTNMAGFNIISVEEIIEDDGSKTVALNGVDCDFDF